MSQSSKKVIVADDEQLALQGMSRIIGETAGLTVVGQAKNGLDAWDQLQNTAAELVVTDIRMPQADGLWLIRQIEENHYPATVIVISAYDDMEYLRAALRSRVVFDYLTKPIVAADLRETLQMALHFQPQPAASTGDLDLDQLLACDSPVQRREMLERYMASDQEELYDFKNRVYGWVVRLPQRLRRPDADLPQTAAVINRIEAAGDKEACAELFLDDVQNRIAQTEPLTGITPLVAATVTIVHQELNNPDLNLAMVAQRLNVTPNYLSGRFSRDMKQSFSSFLTGLRIAEAKKRLCDIRAKVYEVANSVGFEDAGYFNRVFKESTGLTPLQFRAQFLSGGEEEK